MALYRIFGQQAVGCVVFALPRPGALFCTSGLPLMSNSIIDGCCCELGLVNFPSLKGDIEDKSSDRNG